MIRVGIRFGVETPIAVAWRSFAKAFSPTEPVDLTDTERAQLETWVRKPKAQVRHVERVRIILWAANGLTNQAIAARLDTRPACIGKWRMRFGQERLAGLTGDFCPCRAPPTIVFNPVGRHVPFHNRAKNVQKNADALNGSNRLWVDTLDRLMTANPL